MITMLGNDGGDDDHGTNGRGEPATLSGASLPLPTAAARGGAGRPLPPDNSELMDRLKSFLPAMASANEELLAPPPGGTGRPWAGTLGGTAVRLDDGLALDDESESGGDSDDEETDRPTGPLVRELDPHGPGLAAGGGHVPPVLVAGGSSGGAKGPTIELRFGLGDLSGNPLAELLDGGERGDDDAGENDDEDDDEDKAGKPAARLRSVEALLGGDRPEGKKARAAGPLITELS